MCGNAQLLPCPICSHIGVFKTVESLRDKLIYVSTNLITCPVCQENVCGIDKLTVHLFSHVNMSSDDMGSQSKGIKEIISNKSKHVDENNKKKGTCVPSKNKVPQTINTSTSIKYVKIRPKASVVLNNTVPLVNISQVIHNDNVESKSKCDMIKNKTIITNKPEMKNECNVCGLKFAEAKILEVHKNLIHSDQISDTNGQNKYHCHLCTKKFKMRGSLMVHLRVAHYGFLSCDRGTSNDKVEDDRIRSKNKDDKINILERNDNKQWQCDVCQKYFTTKYFLKKHKRLHTGETPYACIQCNKTFTFQQSYHKHLLYHNDDKPHICTQCGRAFKELSTLHNHQRIHTGEKPFSCETCGKCFRQRVSYLVHRRIHTGVMPYKCTACEKSFRYKVSQRTHKCLAQPPGTVVRQSGDLVEKLKRKQNSTENVHIICNLPGTGLNADTNTAGISESNAELVRSSAKLSLEDMESEHFTLIPDCFDDLHSCHIENELMLPSPAQHNAKVLEENIEHLIETLHNEDKSIPSPSEILQKKTYQVGLAPCTLD